MPPPPRPRPAPDWSIPGGIPSAELPPPRPARPRGGRSVSAATAVAATGTGLSASVAMDRVGHRHLLHAPRSHRRSPALREPLSPLLESPCPAAAGSRFGYRVGQPRVQAPRSFGYAGPPRPEDRVPSGGAPGTPAPVAAPPVPVAGTVPVVVSGVPLDTPLPPASRTISPPATTLAPSAPVAAPRPATAASPAPVGPRPRLWGCAPAAPPGASPRLRALRAPETGLQSVTFVCLPAGRPPVQRLAQSPWRHVHHPGRRRR